MDVYLTNMRQTDNGDGKHARLYTTEGAGSKRIGVMINLLCG